MGTTFLRLSVMQLLKDRGLGLTGLGRPCILVVIHWPTREVRQLRYPEVLADLTPEQLNEEVYVYRVTVP